MATLKLISHSTRRLSTTTASKSASFRRMLKKSNNASYDDIFKQFQWQIPEKFNIGYECSDYHVDVGNGTNIALLDHTAQKRYSFNDISLLSNRLCNALQNDLGVAKGDRIGILLPQSYETGISHVAAFKLSAISLPLFILFGHDALQYRLADSECKVLITNPQCFPTILSMRDQLPSLQHVIVTGDDTRHTADYFSFEELLASSAAQFQSQMTHCDDPALIIYTSGTTGSAKGALHAHRVLLGHLPGVEMPHNFFPQNNDVFWTPADWAWIGGLLDALLPSWYYGIPIVAYRAQKFDVAEAFDLMKRYQVTSTFLPPTALKVMKMVSEQHQARGEDVDRFGKDKGVAQFKHALRSIGSGGESLGVALHEWAMKTFGTTINEFYGQTECNLIVSNSSQMFPTQPGSMGKAVPGHTVEILHDDGNLCEAGEVGNICVKSPDPVMFLKYWNNDAKTKAKFIVNPKDGSEWLVTGDLGKKTEEGYFYYDSRDDDVISSRGYRVGPGPIELSILKHPSVVNCAVIGVPDATTTEVIKAFVVCRPGCSYSERELTSEIQMLVREGEGHFVVPKLVEFVHELPMTITGKVQRKILRQREMDKLKQATK